jgi:transposase
MERSRPLLDAYSMKQWIDNNRSVRAIKPFVIDRKNWLFVNTPRDARTSADIYNVIETAKETA